MSASESEERQVGVLRQAYRTVSPSYGAREDAEMNSIGWVILLVMMALFVPLLPFIVVIWLVSKAVEALAGRD
jgi:hypothetical protein